MLKKIKIEKILIIIGSILLIKVVFFPFFSIYSEYNIADNKRWFILEKNKVYKQKFITKVDFFHKVSVITKVENRNEKCSLKLSLSDDEIITKDDISIDQIVEQSGYAFLKFDDKIIKNNKKYILYFSTDCDQDIKMYFFTVEQQKGNNILYIENEITNDNVVLKMEGRKKDYSYFIYPVMIILYSLLSLIMNNKEGDKKNEKYKKNKKNNIN